MKTFLRTFGLALVVTFSLASTAEDQPFKVGDRVTMKINMAEHLLLSRQSGRTPPWEQLRQRVRQWII